MTLVSAKRQPNNQVSFSVTAWSAWAPGIETAADWLAWAENPSTITDTAEPALKQMPPLLRRRASATGKMALEAAFRSLNDRVNVPIIFCSRHGECARTTALVEDLVRGLPVSPASFSLSVHNAIGGLFSIARHDHANTLALSAGQSTVEHAVIEACGLLADDHPAVLLVVSDNVLPPIFAPFQDCREQPFAWAGLLQPPQDRVITLSWSPSSVAALSTEDSDPGGLVVLRFLLRASPVLERIVQGRRWRWQSDV